MFPVNVSLLVLSIEFKPFFHSLFMSKAVMWIPLILVLSIFCLDDFLLNGYKLQDRHFRSQELQKPIMPFIFFGNVLQF